MHINFNQANIELIGGSYNTPESLRNLVKRVDSKSSGLVDIFFRNSNGTEIKIAYQISNSKNIDSTSQKIVGIIGDSDAARFVASDAFQRAVAKAFGITPDQLSIPKTPAYEFLNNVDGIWGDVSESYARSSSGNVLTLTGNGSSGGIWGLRELPALLDNLNVDSIDGLSRPALKQCRAVIQ